MIYFGKQFENEIIYIHDTPIDNIENDYTYIRSIVGKIINTVYGYKYVGSNLNYYLTADDLIVIANKLKSLNKKDNLLEKEKIIQKMYEQEEKDIENFSNFVKTLLKK